MLELLPRLRWEEPDHTPTPWRLSEDGTAILAWDQFGHETAVVSLHELQDEWTEEDLANHRRIVRCVNALALIPDALLEGGAIPELLSQLLTPRFEAFAPPREPKA